MSTENEIRNRADVLLSGPRGRRMLLEYALQSEILMNPVRASDTFGHAAVAAASNLSRTRGGGQHPAGGRRRKYPTVSPSEVAERLSALELADPDPERVRDALAMAVDHARYWEEPDGEDALAELPEMESALRRVAVLVAASRESAWWDTSIANQSQWSVQWDGAEPRPILSTDRVVRLPTGENGGWWSTPPRNVPVSTRLLFDGSPAGLWLVEDNLGWRRAESVRLTSPEDARVFEIARADDWLQLCVRFPRDVSMQIRDAWRRASTHRGRWSVPDWDRVARHYDAVHLQVGAYLSLAGRPITVPGDPGVASMIAGWSPDETYWFTSRIAYGQERVRWILRDHQLGAAWLPDSSEP